MNNQSEVRNDIIKFIDNNPNSTFEQMLDEWEKQGKTFHGDIVREFAQSQGLLSRFK